MAIALESMANTVRSIAYKGESSYFSDPIYTNSPGSGRAGGVKFIILKECTMELYFESICFSATTTTTRVLYNDEIMVSTKGTTNQTYTKKANIGDTITVESNQLQNTSNIILFTAKVQ